MQATWPAYAHQKDCKTKRTKAQNQKHNKYPADALYNTITSQRQHRKSPFITIYRILLMRLSRTPTSCVHVNRLTLIYQCCIRLTKHTRLSAFNLFPASNDLCFYFTPLQPFTFCQSAKFQTQISLVLVKEGLED